MSASRCRTAGTEIASYSPLYPSITLHPLRAQMMIHVAEDAQRQAAFKSTMREWKGRIRAGAQTKQISLRAPSSCDFLSFMGKNEAFVQRFAPLSAIGRAKWFEFLPCFFSFLPRLDCIAKKRGSRNSSFFLVC